MSYRALLVIAATFFLAACGLSEDKYAEDVAELTCERMEECSEGLLTCTPSEGGEEEESEFECDYDKKKAKECIDAMESASCEEFVSGDSTKVCSEVHTNCRPK